MTSSSTKIITLFTLILFLTTLDALKCVCNVNDCDLVKAEDCPGRGVLVWDPCRCCKVCAKTLGETCGGLWGFSGTCEPPLNCISKPPIIGTGICLELPSSGNASSPMDGKNLSCEDKIEILPGCEIVDRTCQCWRDSMIVCNESSVLKWDFESAEECELNLENLLKEEEEFDDDCKIPKPHHSDTRKRRNNSKVLQHRHKKHNTLDDIESQVSR